MYFYKEYDKKPTELEVISDFNLAIGDKNITILSPVVIDKLNASSCEHDKHLPIKYHDTYNRAVKWFAKIKVCEANEA